jgi:hypothetical protein
LRQQAVQHPGEAPAVGGGDIEREVVIEKRHDRVKKYLLPEGTAVGPLFDMGVYTLEGKVAAQMHDKFRQINRFLEMAADALPGDADSFYAVDFGCGKSYLTFITYYFFTEIRGFKNVKMTGLDLKKDVIESCAAAANKYGYSGLSFRQADIADYDCSGADMVISLHACDTATDRALFNAIKSGVKIILAAPCCQHELNAQIKSEDLHLLMRYGAVKERFAALMTDAVRANLLAYCGYRTQLMEFVDLTHTPKNLLIRAVKTKSPKHVKEMYLREAKDLCEAFGAEPELMRLIMDHSAMI